MQDDERPSSLTLRFDGTRADESSSDIKGRVEQRLFGTAPRPLGRYVVIEEVGRGGLGVVVRAYDPKLRREVALKTIRTDTMEPRAQARLVREAQAMARLSHPNVAAVYDVGLEDDNMVLAMEFVAGQTLREWFTARPRPWREVLPIVIAAGRGLAAAHAAGLVHRDFKPDNVLVGDDGRVRVVDFGLARALPVPEPSPSDVASGVELDPAHVDMASPVMTAGELDRTQPDQLIGTPAYMAPEQYHGRTTDARTDQFALCVVLWEALYGQRPFDGDSVMALAFAVTHGNIRATPRDTTVPHWLRGVMERGLCIDADGRYESMDALIRVLERGQARVRTRRSVITAGVLAIAVGFAAVAGDIDRRRREENCRVEAARIDRTWNDDAGEQLRAGILATGVSYAEATVPRVMALVDARAQAWHDSKLEVCLDASVRKSSSPEMLDRATWCLDEHEADIAALIAELSHANADTVERAVRASAGAAFITRCRDPEWLARTPVPSASLREQVRAIRAESVRALALARARELDDAIATARESVERADALDWPPIAALARKQLAAVLETAGRDDEAEAVLERAYFRASAIGSSAIACDAATRLAFVVGVHSGRHADGLRWAEHAELVLGSFAEEDPLRAAALANARAAIHRSAGELAQSRALYEQVLATRERVLGSDHPDVAETLSNLAELATATGQYAQAIAEHGRALEIRERALGAEHPDYVRSRDALARVRQAADASDDARGR